LLAEGPADWRRHSFRKRASDEPWGFDSPSLRLLPDVAHQRRVVADLIVLLARVLTRLRLDLLRVNTIATQPIVFRREALLVRGGHLLRTTRQDHRHFRVS